MLEHIFIAEAQDTIPLFIQKPGARFIVRNMRFVAVLATVQFDDQPCLGTKEISDVRPDRLLAAKAHPIERPIS